MAKYKYSHKGDDEQVGKAVFKDAPISAKHAIEICSAIRYKPVEKVIEFLEAVKKEKRSVTFTRFRAGAGHKSGTSSAKFPVKAADNILKAIKSAESNAIDKGLSKSLKITHIAAQRASEPWHYGRQKRRKMKRTHIEVVVREIQERPQSQKKVESKVEVKPEVTQSSESASVPKLKEVLNESQSKPKTETKKVSKVSDIQAKPEQTEVKTPTKIQTKEKKEKTK